MRQCTSSPIVPPNRLLGCIRSVFEYFLESWRLNELQTICFSLFDRLTLGYISWLFVHSIFRHQLLSSADRVLCEPGTASAGWLWLQTAVHTALNSSSSLSSSSSSSFSFSSSSSSSGGPIQPFSYAALASSSHSLDVLALLSHDAVMAPASFSPRMEYQWTAPTSFSSTSSSTSSAPASSSSSSAGLSSGQQQLSSLNAGGRGSIVSVSGHPAVGVLSPVMTPPPGASLISPTLHADSSSRSSSTSSDGLSTIGVSTGVAVFSSSTAAREELGVCFLITFDMHVSPIIKLLS